MELDEDNADTDDDAARLLLAFLVLGVMGRELDSAGRRIWHACAATAVLDENCNDMSTSLHMDKETSKYF